MALLGAVALTLGACQDARRDAARDHLRNHPPEGFEITALPERILFSKSPDGASQAVVPLRYRLVHPTWETFDARSMPRGREALARIAAERDWAAANLPPDHALRAAAGKIFTSAQTPLPFQREVTPAGTEVDAVTTVTLRRDGEKWDVGSSVAGLYVAGSLSEAPGVPRADPAVLTAKFAELESLATQLEDARKAYLAERQRRRDQSLAQLRALLRTRAAFEGALPDGAPVRLIISQGVEAGAPLIATLTTTRERVTSTRYTGVFGPQPSGEYRWRGRPVAASAGSLAEQPEMTLTAGTDGLQAVLSHSGHPEISVSLTKASEIDMIPEPKE